MHASSSVARLSHKYEIVHLLFFASSNIFLLFPSFPTATLSARPLKHTGSYYYYMPMVQEGIPKNKTLADSEARGFSFIIHFERPIGADKSNGLRMKS